MADRHPMSYSHFRCMALIHDNPLRRLFDSPINTLEAAGTQLGQQVLEVGCGPGFFTIPAAELVGDNGCIHAIDLHPLAIKTVEEKLQRTILSNGVIHCLPLVVVLPELYRVLRPGGALAVQSFASWSKERVVKDGFFSFVGKEGRVFKFRKEMKNESGL